MAVRKNGFRIKRAVHPPYDREGKFFGKNAGIGPRIRSIKAYEDVGNIAKKFEILCEYEEGKFYPYKSNPDNTVPLLLSTIESFGLIELNFRVEYIFLYDSWGFRKRLEVHYNRIKAIDNRLGKITEELRGLEVEKGRIMEMLKVLSRREEAPST